MCTGSNPNFFFHCKSSLIPSILNTAMAPDYKRHLNHVTAPKHWMLNKLTCLFPIYPLMPKYLPQMVLLRNRLWLQHYRKIDENMRTEITYHDVVLGVLSIGKTGDNFCLFYNKQGLYCSSQGRSHSGCAKSERSWWAQK